MMGYGGGNSANSTNTVTNSVVSGNPMTYSSENSPLVAPIHYHSDNFTQTIQDGLDAFMKEPTMPLSMMPEYAPVPMDSAGSNASSPTLMDDTKHRRHDNTLQIGAESSSSTLMEGERPKRRRRRRSPPNAAIDINDNSLYNVYSFFKTFLR